MDQLTNFQELLSTYGFPAVFAFLFLEMVGIPFPAETILVFVGATFHESDLLLLMFIAWLGHVLGSTVGYGLGYYLGRGVLVRFGPYVKLTETKLAKAESLFLKYKITILVFAKFIAVVRILIPFIAGINRLPFVTFTIINSISAAVWVLLFINAGKYVGELLIMIEDSIKANFWMILLLLVLCIGLIYGIRRWRNRQSSKVID